MGQKLLLCLCHNQLVDALSRIPEDIRPPLQRIDDATSSAIDDSVCVVLTSYLPSYHPGPYGGVEKIVNLRLRRNHNPALVMSFESFDSLLTLPENVILAEPGVHHLPLPFRPDEFLAAVDVAHSIPEETTNGIIERSCTIDGQLHTFVSRLIVNLNRSDDVTNFTKRMTRELQRFCSRHYGGWFDHMTALVNGAATSGNKSRALEALYLLRSNVVEASVFRAIENFAHGGTHDMINKAFGPMRAMLVNSRQGYTNVGYVSELIRSNESWRSILARLESLRQEINILCRTQFGINSELSDKIQLLDRALHPLFNGVDASEIIPENLINAIDDVVRIINQLGQDGRKLKEELASMAVS